MSVPVNITKAQAASAFAVGPATGGVLKNIVLTAGSDTATATITAGSNVIATLSAPATYSDSIDYDMADYQGQLTVLLTGTLSFLNLEFA